MIFVDVAVLGLVELLPLLLSLLAAAAGREVGGEGPFEAATPPPDRDVRKDGMACVGAASTSVGSSDATGGSRRSFDRLLRLFLGAAEPVHARRSSTLTIESIPPHQRATQRAATAVRQRDTRVLRE